MQEMCRVIDHNEYDRIQDFVFWFNSGWIMKFIVRLNKYTESNERINYHTEFRYNTKVHGKCITLNRDFSYYFLIESKEKDQNGQKYRLKIYEQDMYYLLFKLSIIESWFRGDSQVFKSKNNKIIITSKGKTTERLILISDSFIDFEPCIIERDGQQIIGVMMYFGSNVTTAFLDMSRFFHFVYIMRNFNMFQSAQIMLNYLISNPGININEFPGYQQPQARFLNKEPFKEPITPKTTVFLKADNKREDS